MVSLRRSAALALVVILAGCAGPSPSTQPTSNSTLHPTAAPTPTSARTPTITPAPTLPTASSPGSTEAPTPSGPPKTAGPIEQWTERADVAAGPSAREDHTWTVDGTGEIAYLFGGRGPGGPSDELWAFDLATDSWSQVTQTFDTPIPAARFGHTATWVPEVGLVIWSGEGSSGFFDDIWSWDPDAGMWTQLPSLGAVPAARYGSCASLGPDGELWISHGFTADSGRFSDTRSYDFETGTWTDRTPADRVPVERCLHDCFWSQGEQLILYGGQTTGVAALGDVWAYDLATGAWTKGAESEAPDRQLYALASASATVFGGGSIDDGFLNDTWVIDPIALTMAPVDAASPPPTRSGATLIDDPARARLLLFGGTNQDGLLADLWELSPTPR